MKIISNILKKQITKGKLEFKLEKEMFLSLSRYDDIIAAMKTSHYKKIKRLNLVEQENKLRYIKQRARIFVRFQTLSETKYDLNTK